VIPAVISDRSSARVLTMEWLPSSQPVLRRSKRSSPKFPRSRTHIGLDQAKQLRLMTT